ncbi:MAG: hypothetical protein NC429_17360 [Lachnospiraceae bacterium]|nr:hypothetical protein [Lachnospiraceae bacterium]
MIEKAINRILELAKPNFMEDENGCFVDKRLIRMDADIRASAISMNTLSSLVDYIKGQQEFKPAQYIVQVISPTEVRLVSALDKDRMRETLAEVSAEIPEFPFGQFIENEKFIINVQSKFMDGEYENNDKAVILAFAGNVKAGTIAKYGDDGVSQKAAVKKGIASLSEVEVPSPCMLIPYRTFTEVSQPASSFIFRVRDDERLGGVACALYEADGGAWKNVAKANIKTFLEEHLKGVENVMVIS